MNGRAKRRFDSYNKYKKRLKKWLPVTYWRLEEKRKTWKDLEKESWSKFLKHTSTPCSCYMCEGNRYDRNKKRQEDDRLINEQLDYLEELMEDYHNFKMIDSNRGYI